MLRSKISLGTSSSLAFSSTVASAVFDTGLGPPFFTLHHFGTPKVNGRVQYPIALALVVETMKLYLVLINYELGDYFGLYTDQNSSLTNAKSATR